MSECVEIFQVSEIKICYSTILSSYHRTPLIIQLHHCNYYVNKIPTKDPAVPIKF
jgi:hypothetical protein